MTPEEFFAILQAAPEPGPVSYRLYHDSDGQVLFYSMEDLPGTWIPVDAVTYAQARHDIRVVGEKIVEIPRQCPVPKLRPAAQGVPCDPRDVCLVVPENQPHIKWSTKLE